MSLKSVWKVVVFPIRILTFPLRWPVKRFGVVKGAAALVTGFCALLLLFNLWIMPALIDMMMAGNVPGPTPVAVAKAEMVDWVPSLEAVGTARAVQGADLAVEAEGVVKAINFTPQSRVTAGTVLVQIDDAVERAQLLAAEANVKLQETDLDRVSTLRKRGANSEAQLDDARNKLAVAQSELERLKAVLDQKAIEAPYDGTVGIPRVDVGQYVTKGTVVVTLQNLDGMTVDFTVPEQSATLVMEGRRVHLGVTSDELALTGRIVGVDPKVNPDTRLVTIRAAVDDPKGQVRPGQFLRVRVELIGDNRVIVLPSTAVITSLFGDYVYVVNEKENEAKEQSGGFLARLLPRKEQAAEKQLIAKQALVKVGRRESDKIEILGGLTEGQVVVAYGQNKLQNNAPVVVKPDSDLAKMAER